MAWAGTRQSIETRVALECEREHQEHFLLSVMLAYRAAEVRSFGPQVHQVGLLLSWVLFFSRC